MQLNALITSAAISVLFGVHGIVHPLYAQTMDADPTSESNRTTADLADGPETSRVDLHGSHDVRLFIGPGTNREMQYAIYLPKGYAKTDRRFPVMYFLHGAGVARQDELIDNYGLWQTVFYDRAIAEGIIPPMIIAMPVTRGVSLWANAKDGSTLAFTQFIDEFIPYIDRNYRTIADRRARIVEGFSMGGNGAVIFGAKHPDLFCGVISIDGAHHSWDTLGEYRRADIASETFGSDEMYFRQFSPDHLIIANSANIREQGTEFILLVGQLKSYNERLRGVMESEGISLRYTDTTFQHEMPKLRRHDRDAIFALINKYFSSLAQ